jgi:asparagine synthase (glutamine-hydrolysing)
MGVKPFFYAHVGSLVVISNTLECVRRHPAVSRKLNDLGIADFLLFEMNQDPATTTFADVNRLPAAHVLECDRNSFSVRRYWTLSVLEPIIFKHEHEYIERFLELLDQAVADRMPGDSAGIMLSGGLDSSTIAASARRIVTKFDNKTELFAYTSVLNNLVPDKEGHFASLVAMKLNIPVVLQALDEYRLFDRAGEPECLQSEPENSAWPGNYVDQLREISKKSKVALNGQGSDPGFASRITVHFSQLLNQGRYFQALADATEYLSAKGRFSRLYIRGRLRALISNQNPYYDFPGWLNEDFERNFGLRDRWITYALSNWDAIRRVESTFSGFRPEAILVMSHVGWQKTFEEFDPGTTRSPVEVRYPFFDLRLVTFLLRLPRLPWCCDKEMLRRAGRGVLPELVRLRPKAPLRHDPTLAVLQKPESAWVDHFEPIPQLDQYIDRAKVPPVYMEKIPSKAWLNLRPLSLKFWLQGVNGL